MDNVRLRNFRENDFEAFHALCSDYDVVKMLSSWPYPADPEFTRMRMNTPEAQAGQGYATEATRAFLQNAIEVFALDEVSAGTFMDNPASQRVLEKLGFVRVGEKMHNASGRLEEAPLFLYRLDKSKIRTKQ